MSFLGEYPCKCDAKGRVSFPAQLRKQNPSADSSSYVLSRAPYVPALMLYTLQDFEAKMSDVIGRLNRDSREGDELFRLLVSNTEHVVLDGNNRLLLSKRQLSYIGSSGELTFVGSVDHVEIWDPGTYLETLARGDRSMLQDRLLGGSRGTGEEGR